MSNQLYKVLKPIGYGGRREVGEVIELDEKTAKQIGDEYVALESTPVTTGDNVEDKAAVQPEKASKPAKKK